MDELITMTEDFGGFVVSTMTGTEYYNNDPLPYVSMTVRVPAEKLLEALNFIEGTTGDKSKNVTKKEITGTDITREYVDNQSRLAGMEKTLAKLYEILDTAENAEEALAVYNNISSVETDIEILKGDAKYMEEAVAYSSITIRINSIRPAAIATAQKWEPIEAVKDAFAGLIEFGKHLVEFLIYFIIIGIPCIAVIGLIVWGIVKLCKKIFKNKKTPAKKSEKTTEEQDPVE